MKCDLDPAKAVIRAFFSEIEAVKKNQKSISQPMRAISFSSKDKMPEFNANEFTPAPDSFWEKEDAYIWLYAEPRHYHSFMHRPKSNMVPEYYRQPALPVYLQWRNEEKEVFYRKCAMIPSPPENMPLADYLQQLALTVSEQNEHRDVWIESLRCFLQFLREDTDLDQQGALEVIFPYKMEFREGYSFQRKEGKVERVECRYILRRVDDAVYPIDILAAAEILQNLAKIVLEGRSNLQRSAAEALGFAWLCQAVGSYRLTTREEIVFSTPLAALKPPSPIQPKEFFRPEYHIGIKSLFGIIDVPISKVLYEFLLALPRDASSDRIFALPWRTLLRTFQNKGVAAAKRTQDLGKISFLTFMSQPHEAIGHRPSPMKRASKSKGQ